MIGRRFRVRYIALFFLAALVLLYVRRPSYVEPYVDKAGSMVGGGSVMRPEGNEALPPAQEPKGPENPAHELTVPPATTPGALLQSASEESPAIQTLSEYNPAKQWVPIAEEDRLPHEQGVGRVTIDLPSTTTSNVIHWTRTTEHFSLTSTIQLPSGKPSPMPKLQKANLGSDKDKLALIKTAVEWNWEGYKDKAWGHDELKPVTGGFHDVFNGWGATLVDSLDTLWIVGMKEEFDDAVKAVAKIDFTTSSRWDIPIFETTIRYLGGLVAAFDISGQQQKYRVLLEKAVELGEVLYSAFDTPNRMPLTYYYWKPTFASQPHRATTRVVLAELGSLSLEFTRLAQITGDSKFYDAIARITNALAEWQNNTRVPGMWPTYVDASGCAKPAQIGGSMPLQQSLPEGADGWGEGYGMHAGTPVQQNDRTGESERNTQANLKDSVAAGRAGMGKILGHGNPILEGSLDDPIAKAELLGSSKLKKREGYEGPDNSDQSSASRGSTQASGINDLCQEQGLASSSSRGSESFTLGGQSDSTYEYLSKQWMLLGGQVDAYRDMYTASADTETKKLLFKPMTPDNLDILISGELKISVNITSGDYIESLLPKSAHLTCFAGGMFALGGILFDRPEDVEIGKKLTDGCVWAYNSTTTGIMPEDFTAIPCERADGTPMNGFEKGCAWNQTRYYEELDPYRDSRTKWIFGPTATKTSELVAAESTAQSTATSAVDIAKRHSTLDGEPAIAKRQLDAGLEVVEVATSSASATNLADSSSAVAKKTASTDASGTAATDVPAQPAAAPVYTPQPPLSHKEYVENKITDERLPPGMARINSNQYILRPEAIESVFYLYRITGDVHWREAGWAMYTSIQDHTRGVLGNSAIDDVTKSSPDQLDSMESFWLAETLKYFWLLFEDESEWSLDEWVLNTEAHFFKRPK